MESIKGIYRIGHGPSSSHTMGPRRAAEEFLERNRGAARYEVTLYGSLAATGRGHLTDKAILEVLEPAAPTVIHWRSDIFLPFHPNGMQFESFFGDEEQPRESWRIYSIGGGSLANEQTAAKEPEMIYDMSTITEIQAWCDKTGCSYWEYVEQCEGPEIWDYLDRVWSVMQAGIRRGLETEGVLPGGLGVRRKASDYRDSKQKFHGFSIV